MTETEHLLSTAKNRERLRESMKDNTTSMNINYFHIDVCQGQHEYVDVTMSRFDPEYSGVVSSYKQCKNCGKFMEGSVTYNRLPNRFDAAQVSDTTKDEQ